jgi:hypothetical protein
VSDERDGDKEREGREREREKKIHINYKQSEMKECTSIFETKQLADS